MQRMPTIGALAVLVALGASAGCARDQRVNYPRTLAGDTAGGPGVPRGSVTVRLTHAVSNLAVTVNGFLVAAGKHTKQVTVVGVPAGRAVVSIAAGGRSRSRVEKSVEIDVRADADTAIAVAAPEMSTASAIYWGLFLLGDWIFLASMYAVILL